MVVLELLALIKANPRLTPSEIADLMELSRPYVRNMLSTLKDLGLVKTPVRGVYVITKLGECLLDQNFPWLRKENKVPYVK